jgi:hypothetical protein
MAWVVRAGEAKAVDLVKGYREHLGVPGLYGFSVQYQAGISWQELARAGLYPNAQVSIAEEDELRVALRSLGYDFRLVASPGSGYHHTFVVLYDATGTMLTQLPLPVAEKLHQTFTQETNPHRVRPGRTP